MTNQIKKIIKRWGLGLFLASTIFLLFPSSSIYAWSNAADQPAQLFDLEFLFETVVRLVTTLAGVVVLVMFVVGGFQYLTAGDNPKEVEKANKTLTFAIGGLIVIISAWLILQAIETITGLNVTIFRMPRPRP